MGVLRRLQDGISVSFCGPDRGSTRAGSKHPGMSSCWSHRRGCRQKWLQIFDVARDGSPANLLGWDTPEEDGDKSGTCSRLSIWCSNHGQTAGNEGLWLCARLSAPGHLPRFWGCRESISGEDLRFSRSCSGTRFPLMRPMAPEDNFGRYDKRRRTRSFLLRT